MIFAVTLTTLLLVLNAKAKEDEKQLAALQKYGCMESLGINDSMRTHFLNLQNQLRSSIARGTFVIRRGNLGPVKNMYKLDWDCNLEQIAKQSIASCSNNISTNIPRNLISIDAQTGPYADLINIEKSFIAWRLQPRRHTLTGRRTIDDPKLSDFANMAYAKTTKVGCSYKLCGSKFFAACAYNKLGSQLGTTLWEEAKHPCKTNRDCTTYKGSICENHLCIDLKGYSNDSEPVKRGSVNGSTCEGDQCVNSKNKSNASEPVKRDMCNLNNEMTDEARIAVLNEHNRLRSLVAKGLAENPNGTNGTAPKAARMLKMVGVVYDCEIEETALKQVKKCVFVHSLPEDIPGLGENLWTISGKWRNITQMVIWASRSWFSELRKAGMPADNRLTDEVWNRPKPIGHYTQMVWEGSYRLGCAVAVCERWTYVTCQYGPAGNNKMLVYTIGEPCKKDEDCGCKGCTCSRDEALCIKPTDSK